MTLPLSYQIDGPESAPPLVVLNSVGATTAMWDAVLARLTARMRVIRIDTRGHGGSPPAPPGRTSLADLGGDVLRVLDDLGLATAHVAGLSLGGMTAMWLAAHYPARVARLSVLCTSAYLPPPEFWLDRAARVRVEGMAPIADAVVGRWVSEDFAGRRPDAVGQLQAMIKTTDPETYAQCCEAIAGMDLRADLPHIDAPTLVLAGELDPATPPEHGRVIAEGVPHGRLVVLAEAAHLAAVEQPEEVAALLIDHFTGGEATRRAVLGDAHVDRAAASTTDFTAPFQDFITRYAWGEVWGRPGLSRRDRSIATLTALTALGAEHELGMHVRAALRNGLTRQEIAEVLLHTSVYAGVPRGNRAFNIAQEVLDEEAR
jgi:3-oxoadipate enol-lactonase/4-carboxymuconolactone decarboxylase